jgi:hypothetical protein
MRVSQATSASPHAGVATEARTGTDGTVLRRVGSQAEYAECVRIQDEVWGAGFAERVPATILAVGSAASWRRRSPPTAGCSASCSG